MNTLANTLKNQTLHFKTLGPKYGGREVVPIDPNRENWYLEKVLRVSGTSLSEGQNVWIRDSSCL
jgi:hypothetical protein